MTTSYKDPRFQRALNHVLKFEGGYVDHPKDPGGATKFGITLKTLANWRKVSPWWQLPKQAVKQMGRIEASKIYFQLYWRRSGADRMPEALGFAVFDYAVNSGPQTAIKQLQKLLKIKADGIVGPVTEAAVRQYCRQFSQDRLLENYLSQRLGFLKSLRTFAVFGRGWSNRIAKVLAISKKIISETNQKKGPTTMNILTGYKTYLVALFMLLSGVLELLGVNIPAIDASNAMQLVMESLAIIFLRKGLKTEIANA